jgi:DUF2934 family protein
MAPLKKTSTSPTPAKPKRTRRTVIPSEPQIVTAADIARRAYEIYESRGRIDGTQLDDWLEAERQLLSAN